MQQRIFESANFTGKKYKLYRKKCIIIDKSANSSKNCNFYRKSVELGKLPILHRKVCKIKKKLKCLCGLNKLFFLFFKNKSPIELWILLQNAGEFNSNIKFQCNVDERTTHVLWNWSQVTYSESVCCHYYRFVLTLFEKTVYCWIDCVTFDESVDHAFCNLA